MRRPVTQLTLLVAAATMATGCVPVRHNLPPEQRLMEPGPGVGGPGPGVLGPVAVGPGAGMGMMGQGMMGPGMGACPPGYPGGQMPMGPYPMGTMGQHPMGPMGPMGQHPMGPMGPMGPHPSDQYAPGQYPGPDGLMVPSGPDGDIRQTNYSTCGPEGCGPMGGMGMGGMGIGGGTIPPGGGVLPTGAMMPMAIPTVQVTFGRPEAMHVRYDATGNGLFDSEPLIVPARQNFPQGGLYRLKITNIVNREGVELYPTLELAFGNPRTGAYLAHNSIPVQFTEEDFDQVLTGNFVTKVIYLPDPDFQGPALAGIDTLVSTRLDPGVDPIVEADRRGSILAIIRLGDKDIEMAGVNQGGGMLGPAMLGGGMMAPGMMGGVPGMPMPFAPSMTEGCGPYGAGGAGGPSNLLPPSLPGMVAGVTAPQYGMPFSGTPIGLPGPPHIPLGAPAGLQKHVIKNHTPMHLPQPVSDVKMHIRQAPGQSYPNPVSRIHMTEQNVHPGIPHGRPHYDAASQRVK
jgi:hypothetical protein